MKSLLCDLAYRSLTHSTIKEKRVIDVIFHILGVAIKNYRHGVAFPVQIVEIMDREESVVAPITYGLCYLKDTLGMNKVMEKLLAEMIDKVNVNPSPTMSKNLSAFITEIGVISAELSLQCLDTDIAQQLLDLDVSLSALRHSNRILKNP